jgi:hypothetical protein
MCNHFRIVFTFRPEKATPCIENPPKNATFIFISRGANREIPKNRSEPEFMPEEKENTSGVTARAHVGKCKTREIYCSFT